MKKTYKWSQRLKVRNRGDRLCPGHMFVPFVMNISFSFFCSSRDCLDIVNQLIINVNVWPERWQEFLESCRLAVFTPWGQLIFHYKIHCFFSFLLYFSCEMGLAESRQEAFWEACGFGHVERAKVLLKEGDINVNWVSYTVSGENHILLYPY